MARSHARLLTSIWGDRDFCALTSRARETYFFLISQPDLEHSGVIGLRIERWADDLADTEDEDIRGALEQLAERRFVVIDWRKQEVLVRSLIRRDDVWRQPNVFKSAAGSIRAVRSPAIKAALLAELERLDLSSANHDVVTLRGELAEELKEALGNPSGNPSPTLPGRVPPDPAEAQAEGSALAPGKGSSNGEVPPGAPSPLPLPLAPAIPPPAGAASPRADEAGGGKKTTSSKRGPRKPSNNAGDIIAAYVEGAIGAGLLRPAENLRERVGKDAKALLAQGYQIETLVESARRMGAGEWNDLAVQLRKDDVAANGNGGGPGKSGGPGKRTNFTDEEYARGWK